MNSKVCFEKIMKVFDFLYECFEDAKEPEEKVVLAKCMADISFSIARSVNSKTISEGGHSYGYVIEHSRSGFIPNESLPAEVEGHYPL